MERAKYRTAEADTHIGECHVKTGVTLLPAQELQSSWESPGTESTQEPSEGVPVLTPGGQLFTTDLQNRPVVARLPLPAQIRLLPLICHAWRQKPNQGKHDINIKHHNLSLESGEFGVAVAPNFSFITRKFNTWVNEEAGSLWYAKLVFLSTALDRAIGNANKETFLRRVKWA